MLAPGDEGAWGYARSLASRRNIKLRLRYDFGRGSTFGEWHPTRVCHMLGSPMVGETMMKTIRSGGRKAIALSVACALMLPMAAVPDTAHAQSKSKKASSREAELESRVNQLE